MWSQVYDPFGNAFVSTLVAALPIAVLLGGIGLFRLQAHVAAFLGLLSSLLVATLAFRMPAGMAAAAALAGAAYGFLPIGWIVLNVIFLYQLTVEKGSFGVLQESIASLTPDRRLQLVLIAFSLGAFFEGAAGFGTPVAVTGAMLIGVGFRPLQASGLSLIANTAPVAYGALGTPVIALGAVTGLDLHELSGMIGRQLPLFSLIVPFWLIWSFAGFRGMLQVWPALLVAGVAFAIPQYLISNFHGPWLVDVVGALSSLAALTLFLRVWQPREIWRSVSRKEEHSRRVQGSVPIAPAPVDVHRPASGKQPRPGVVPSEVIKAWSPWIVLSLFVFLWGLPQVKAFLDGLWLPKVPVPGLHNLVQKVPPVVPKPAVEAAIYSFTLLSATGTGILLAACVGGVTMGYSLPQLAHAFGRTCVRVRFSLLTIVCMLAIGYVTRYSGTDATLGLAFAHAGSFYPFFGALLGWLGVALTGSDTASNVLFGGLQKVTAQQIGLSPVLMAAANSSGGVMGKMVDAQSIVVASTATQWYGHESEILRYVFFHSLALAALVGFLVAAQAHLYPLTLLVH
ncbi:MAG: L-lactate permease [Verrucomicrobia bacterium]|nr:L-lactate permease [Verrucomicrobiota bacterium]